MTERTRGNGLTRLGAVRVRTTIAATIVVSLALAAGAVALVVLVRHSLASHVADAAWLRAGDIATTLSGGTSPPTTTIDATDDFVQIVDADGRVVAASDNVSDTRPLVVLAPGETQTIDGTALGEREPYRVVAVDAMTPDGEQIVLVGRSLESLDEATGILVRLLPVGGPVLLVIVAATTWLLVGRTLAPVEAIRRQVAAISAADLRRRVPQPAGQDEIARLAATMNAMLERLDAAQQRQRQFISDASHELRSPAASIRHATELALVHPELTTTTQLATGVLEEDLRIQRLVEDLLTLARADERALHPRRQVVDLDDVVLAEADRLRASSEVAVDTSAVSGGQVRADESHLTRVVRNLSENAVRHAAGRVAFALAEDERQVVLTVDDDGPGIPPTDRGRVFDRFTRLDDARARDHGGAGLGLAIVRELVAVNGGDLRIADAPSGGARFEVTFPAAGAVAAATRVERSREDTRSGVGAAGARRRSVLGDRTAR